MRCLTLSSLGTVPGGRYSVVTDTDDSGGHAVVRPVTNAIRELGTLPGGSDSRANDVNDHLLVVDQSTTDGDFTRATLWRLTPR